MVEGPIVGIRPVLPGDYVFLEAVESEVTSGASGVGGRGDDGERRPSSYGFELWHRAHVHRLLYRVATGEAIGLVTSYNYSSKNRSAWLSTMCKTSKEGRGEGLAGLGLFISWLFDQYDLRVLYAESDEVTFGERFARIAEVSGVEECGRLRRDRLINGTLSDTILLSFQRLEWERGIGRFVRSRAMHGLNSTSAVSSLGLHILE